MFSGNDFYGLSRLYLIADVSQIMRAQRPTYRQTDRPTVSQSIWGTITDEEKGLKKPAII